MNDPYEDLKKRLEKRKRKLKKKNSGDHPGHEEYTEMEPVKE